MEKSDNAGKKERKRERERERERERKLASTEKSINFGTREKNDRQIPSTRSRTEGSTVDENCLGGAVLLSLLSPLLFLLSGISVPL